MVEPPVLRDKEREGYAIRYAAGFEDIVMVLSGMSTIEQMEENIKVMKDFEPLNNEEFALLDKAVEMVLNNELRDGKTQAAVLKVKLLRDKGLW